MTGGDAKRKAKEGEGPDRSQLRDLLLAAFVLLVLAAARNYSYLLFHSTVEVASIAVACGVFMLAWNSRLISDNPYLLFVGIALLAVSGIDLLHTLAYKGMGVFPGYGSNLATQLWVAGRYLQSFSLLSAPLAIGKRLDAWKAMAALVLSAAILVTSVFGGLFPDCYVEGEGLTSFKVVSEYVICLILALSVKLMHDRREAFEPGVLRLLVASIVIVILSELAFTLYVDVYGFFNMLGHLLRLSSVVLLYKVVFVIGIGDPVDALMWRAAFKGRT